MDKTPILSVWMTTYNHERFIGKAIESVAMQNTTFPIELVIGEDCSTDGTRTKILEYKEKFPDLIFPVFREKNIGMMPNALDALSKCKGKYIACLEGDDYWIDKTKLQKQVDFLESNPEFVVSTHNSELIDENGNKAGLFNSVKVKSTLNFTDILKSWQVPTASMVFRKESLEVTEWLKNVANGDLAILCLLAYKGKVAYNEDVMCAYRKHSAGASLLVNNDSIRYLKKHRDLWLRLNEYYGSKYNLKIKLKILKVNIHIFLQELLKRFSIFRSIRKLYYKMGLAK